MLPAPVRRAPLLLVLVSLGACPPAEAPDAGLDAAVPVACNGPAGCITQGPGAVCRQSTCRADAPCGDDLECGLGERCVAGQCRFRGCLQDADCATGRCRTEGFACVECGADSDCPPGRPACEKASATCVACQSDDQCPPPGPGHCGAAGRCTDCLEDAHCPNGLHCGPDLRCTGAGLQEGCDLGTSCAPSLVCVTVNNQSACLTSCNLYQPHCENGDVCFKLTYAGDTSLVFENEGPLGVCYPPQAGLRDLREPCARTATGSNCQVNLICVPDTAQVSLCRAFCNPDVSGACPVTEHCQGFVGDWNGRRYGVCLPNNGFGLPCTGDGQCKPNLSCQAYDDPGAWTSLTTLCQFNVGAQPGLAPCAPRPIPDGGVVPADRACQSGACRTEGLGGGAPWQCFAACKTNADCTVGGRAGFCDGTFSFSTPNGSSGTVAGCRPGCAEALDCAGYDAGLTCRLRAVNQELHPTCGPPLGLLPAGAPCVQSAQCRSGWCQVDDARFVGRQGTCLEACRTPAGCQAPGAAYPMTCAPTITALGRGPDGLALTSDDALVTMPLCVGLACGTDLDCAPDGGPARCVPEVAPDGGLSPRCRLPTLGGLLEAGQPCAVDAQCATGVCGQLQAPSTGTGRACFGACGTCPGPTTCRAGGMRVQVSGGEVSVDTCAP